MSAQSEEQLFVDEGVFFTVDKEEDGKYVVDIAADRRVPFEEIQNWARVVGRFDTLGDAITAAKYEMSRV